MSYPILYKRNTNGSIQQWQIFIKGDKYWIEQGKVEGKITVSKPQFGKPKNIGKSNETTAEEQAQVEAKAKFDKKLKENYFEDINNVDDGFKEPMLAKKFSQYKHKLKYPVAVDIKLNGCLDESSLIKTKEFGYLTIKDIVDKKIKCKVLSYNERSSKCEYKNILNYFEKKDDNEWYLIKLNNGSELKVTGNHEVYLPDLKCWRRVDALSGTENLMVS